MNHLTLVAALLAGSALASAQTRSADLPAPQPGAMVTVEGCVSKEDRAGASTAAAQHVLTDRARATTTAGVAPASTTTSSGATTAGQPSPARKMYVLRAHDASMELARYVGQMVRVTGATTAPMTSAPLAGRSPEATPNPAPTGPPGSTGTPFDTANLPTLAVTTIVKIDGSCK